MGADSARRSPSDTEQLHRTATKLAGVVAAFFAGAYLVKALLDGDANMALASIGPGLIAVLALGMVWTGRYRAHIALIVAVVTMTISFKLFGGEHSDPTFVALALVTAAGAVLMPSAWKWPYVTLGGFQLMTMKAYWDGLSVETIRTGVAGTILGVSIMIIFIRLRDSMIASNRRYQVLVERLPVPLIEQDWSHVRQWLAECRAKGVTDIEAYMDSHPGELVEVLRRIRVRGVNPAIAGLVGPDGLRRGLDSDNTYGITHESMAVFVRQEIVGMWDGTGPLPGDYVMRRTRGDQFWARLEAADITDESIPGVDRVIVATDVTELKNTQDALGQQLRSKDEFIAAVSHELRTPLTSVLGFAELMSAESENLSDAQLEMLGHLAHQANDMSHIVEDLLVAARAEVGTVVLDEGRVDLNPIIDQMVAELNAGFAVHHGADLTVFGDRIRVAQVLRNLMTNAHRYGGDDRSIHISQGVAEAIVEVKDNGPGIPIEDHERVFEPYVRAHNRPGMAASVGLGLTVSRQLAELMGGSVTYSRDGAFTVFRLALPLAAAGSVV